MSFSRLQRTLIARGYWEEAGGDAGDGGAGGSPGADDAAKAEAERVAAEAAKKKAEEEKKSGISDESAKLLKELMAKKAKEKELQDKINELTGTLAKFEGIDLDEVKRQAEEKKKAEEERLAAQGQWEILKKQIIEENKKIVDAERETAKSIAEENAKLKEIVDALTVGNTFGNSSFIKNDLEISPAKVKTLYGSYFDLDGTSMIGYDKPVGAADRAPLIDASGNHLSFDESLKKIIESDPDSKPFFKIKAKQGSGSGTSGLPPSKSASVQKLKGSDRIAKALRDDNKA